MTKKNSLCIRYKKAVGDYEIHITVTQTGRRSFSILKVGTGAPSGIASGSIHWGTKDPVRYNQGAPEVPSNVSDLILRASYDMYL